MVISNFFQSIGHAGKSIFLSVSRQMLFLIPGLLILPRYWGLDGVWISIPISDLISVFFAAGMLWWTIRKYARPH
jgi:Na+-driven multidrug efflux pump